MNGEELVNHRLTQLEQRLTTMEARQIAALEAFQAVQVRSVSNESAVAEAERTRKADKRATYGAIGTAVGISLVLGTLTELGIIG